MRPKQAFTIVEVIVVMAILGVLAALILSAIIGVKNKGPEVKVKVQLTNLGDALERFKSDFHDRYPPSTILLREDWDYSLGTPEMKRSVNLLRELWPNIKLKTLASEPAIAADKHCDFDGNGTTTGEGHTLYGMQCLVFFLGGMPDRNSSVGTGFSRDPQFPFQWPGGNVSSSMGRSGPYFEFEAKYLVSGGSSPFKAVADAGGNDAVIVYFSSYNGRGYRDADCNGLLNPYTKAGVTGSPYWNPDTFQLISAGRDGKFGAGGAFTPSDPNVLGDDDKDNQANFHDGTLGKAGGG